jgi:hypothetical protein
MYEDIEYVDKVDSHPLRDQWPLFSRAFPGFYGYRELVRESNQKRLGRPEDALEPFADIISALSRIFDGGFLPGLPEMFFDVVLRQPQQELKRISSKVLKLCCQTTWIRNLMAIPMGKYYVLYSKL